MTTLKTRIDELEKQKARKEGQSFELHWPHYAGEIVNGLPLTLEQAEQMNLKVQQEHPEMIVLCWPEGKND